MDGLANLTPLRIVHNRLSVSWKAIWDHEGRFVISGSSMDGIRGWRMERSSPGPINRLSATQPVRFSPDSKSGATCTVDGHELVLGSTQDDREIARAPRCDRVHGFTSDGRRLVIQAPRDDRLRWCRVPGLETDSEVPLAGLPPGVVPGAVGTLSPDDSQLFRTYVDHADSSSGIVIWDVNSGGVRRLQRTDQLRVVRLELSLDGRWMLTSGNDETAQLWDLAACKVLHQFRGTTHSVCDIGFSRDGELIHVGWFDGTLAVFDRNSGRRIARFDLHRSLVASFSHDRQTLIAHTHERLHFLKVSSGRIAGTLRVRENFPFLQLSPHDTTLSAVSLDNILRSWRAPLIPEISRERNRPVTIALILFGITPKPAGTSANHLTHDPHTRT